MKLANSKRALIGWQTLLADLSLILFMVTAAAMAVNPAHLPPVETPPAPPRAVLSEPLALWRGGGSQTLRHWLAGEEPDARQQLTITARYRRGTAMQAMAATQALLGQAGVWGRDARVIITPAAGADADETLVSLAYDQGP